MAEEGEGKCSGTSGNVSSPGSENWLFKSPSGTPSKSEADSAFMSPADNEPEDEQLDPQDADLFPNEADEADIVETRDIREKPESSKHAAAAVVAIDESEVKDMRLIRLRLDDLNPHLMCRICSGYFRDAHTITECLHTFCKSCLLRHFDQGHRTCPHCKVFEQIFTYTLNCTKVNNAPENISRLSLAHIRCTQSSSTEPCKNWLIKYFQTSMLKIRYPKRERCFPLT